MEEVEEEEEDPCGALLSFHNATGGRDLDVMEYLAKCSGPSRVTSSKLFTNRIPLDLYRREQSVEPFVCVIKF